MRCTSHDSEDESTLIGGVKGVLKSAELVEHAS